jgi:hypothetical protein
MALGRASQRQSGWLRPVARFGQDDPIYSAAMVVYPSLLWRLRTNAQCPNAECSRTCICGRPFPVKCRLPISLLHRSKMTITDLALAETTISVPRIKFQRVSPDWRLATALRFDKCELFCDAPSTLWVLSVTWMRWPTSRALTELSHCALGAQCFWPINPAALAAESRDLGKSGLDGLPSEQAVCIHSRAVSRDSFAIEATKQSAEVGQSPM